MLKIYLSDDTTEVTGIKEIAYKECVNAESSIRSGGVTAAYIEANLFAKQANAIAAGTELHLFRDSTKIAVLYADPVIDDSNAYKLTAYDGIKKLDADFSQWLQANQSNFPMTVYALVSAACTVAGVTLGSSSWALSTQNVQAFYADGLTCRDILSYAAELGCKFVRCHADGSIYFDWFSSSANSIAPSAGTNQYAYKIGGLTYANYTTTALARVAVHPSGEDDVAYIYPTNVTSGNTLHVKNNLLLTGASASFFNAAAQEIYNGVYGLGVYRPMTAELFPNESPFRAGDVISVTDNQNVSFTAIVTSMTVSATSAVVESAGEKEYEEIPDTGKSLVQLASDIVRINKLKVDWAEIGGAIVQYLTAHDITAQNLTIVDENDNVLATFNSSGITFYNSNRAEAFFSSNGVQLGRTDRSHVFIDYNSFELLTGSGSDSYVRIGDMRDSTGYAEITETFDIETSTNQVQVQFAISSVVSVTVNGDEVTDYTVSPYFNIIFSSSISAGSVVVVDYKTASAAYRYDLGRRKLNSGIGGNSFIAGWQNEASGTYSAAVGGLNNESKGHKAFVGGGTNNKATRTNASVVGGANNEASGYGSSVLGGDTNKANGQYSFIGGGEDNTASGESSAILGGSDNEVSAKGAFAFGTGLQATAARQIVFGMYNTPDTPSAVSRGQYVEIVGKGNRNSNRSNARTLDWNGNEVLAGGLTTGGAIVSGGDITAPSQLTLGGKYGTTSRSTPPVGTMEFYRYDASTTHTPYTEGLTDAPSGMIMAFSADANNCAEIAITDSGTTIFHRRKKNGAWGYWYKIYNSASTDKPTASELGVFDLNLGEEIPANANLNDYNYTSVGVFYVASPANAATIANTPTTSSPYKLVVMKQSANTHAKQIAFITDSDEIYIRYQTTLTAWSAWSKNLTEVNGVPKAGGTMSGQLINSSYFTRKFASAPSAVTNYYIANLRDETDANRGGFGFYRSNTYGDGLRFVHYKTVNGNDITNGISMYISDTGTPAVVFGQPAAWRDGLSVVPKYVAGDTVSFPTSGTSYYLRFHGDWRYSYTLYFLVPLSRSCEGLSATVSGTIYVVTNGQRNSVNISSVATVNCACTPCGVAVQLNWGSGNAPSLGQAQYADASVQPYGFTITFS